MSPKSKFVDNQDPTSSVVLSYNFNCIGILIALGQLAFSVTTLYRTQGDQIARYGYAAFGLTATPYAVMSLVNLLGNLMCPQFPSIYLVKSEEMEEALLDDPETVIEGYVGEILNDNHQIEDQKLRERGYERYIAAQRALWAIPYLNIFPIAASIGIIGGLSGFKYGASTHAQRAWTMCWLALGSYIPNLVYEDIPNFRKLRREQQGSHLDKKDRQRRSYHTFFQRLGLLLLYAVLSIPAAGGFVVVGQMLKEYGVCTRLD